MPARAARRTLRLECGQPIGNSTTLNISPDNPLAIAVVEAIHEGDVASLKRVLEANPGLATARIGDPKSCDGMSRTLLHVATDWPGHFPNGAATIAALVELEQMSTPGLPAHTPRRRFIGPQAAMTLRCWTRCSTRALTLNRPVR